jgi:DNA-binding GntR family transcriptional regulator
MTDVAQSPIPTLPAVEQSLWSAFVSRTILPGQPVIVAVWAHQHGVPAEVVERVLESMVEKGLVTRAKPSGYVAREMLTRRQLAEIFVVRNQLEPWLAEEAAKADIREEHATYLRKLASIPAAPTLPVLAQRDAAFHGYIGKLSRLGFVHGAVESLNAAFHVYRRIDGHSHAPVSDSEHVAIAEAVIAGDAEEARNAMQRHLMSSSTRLLTDGS